MPRPFRPVCGGDVDADLDRVVQVADPVAPGPEAALKVDAVGFHGQTGVRMVGEDSKSGLRRGTQDACDGCDGSGLCGKAGASPRGELCVEP